MGKLYLCYDLRGIQSYIFKIPRLKYIVGGSALVDRFDREIVPGLAEERGWNRICSAGGKGAFLVADEAQAEQIQDELVAQARYMGIDIRFGRHREYSEAANCANRLFPYLPRTDELDGHPCPESGLYPTRGKGPHAVVRRRRWSRDPVDGGFDRMDRWFEDQRNLLDGVTLRAAKGRSLAFMRSADEDDDPGSMAGFRALGSRNRWAVICMDGNDMGRQFRSMMAKAGEKSSFTKWLEDMSFALDQCSERACRAGIARVLELWERDENIAQDLQRDRLLDGEEVVIPIRPLVVGGDDITVLCHAAHATEFVRRACAVFNETSKQLAAQAPNPKVPLWPGTGGELTISAGILYCGTTLPLATAIPYAHDLLSQAKAGGRKRQVGRGSPAPAFVDFEAVTETLLDSPRSRRERELEFRDGDREDHVRIVLTRRPYDVADLDALERDLEALALPTTTLHQVLPGLRQGSKDRQIFYARLGKHHGHLLEALDETGRASSRWREERDGEGRVTRTIDLVDMAILAKESRRMEETIG